MISVSLYSLYCLVLKNILSRNLKMLKSAVISNCSSSENGLDLKRKKTSLPKASNIRRDCTHSNVCSIDSLLLIILLLFCVNGGPLAILHPAAQRTKRN